MIDTELISRAGAEDVERSRRVLSVLADIASELNAQDEELLTFFLFPSPEEGTMEMHSVHETLSVQDADVTDARFANAKLERASFNDVNLRGAAFTNVNLSDVTFADINLTNVSIKNANLTGMTINGVPVYEMIAAYQARENKKS